MQSIQSDGMKVAEVRSPVNTPNCSPVKSEMLVCRWTPGIRYDGRGVAVVLPIATRIVGTVVDG